MMSRRMLVFLVVMASLVATGRPALLSPEAVLPQPIASRPWTERLNVGRTQSRIGVLQRMTLSVPPRSHNAIRAPDRVDARARTDQSSSLRAASTRRSTAPNPRAQAHGTPATGLPTLFS